MNQKGLVVGLVLLLIGTSVAPITAQEIGKSVQPSNVSDNDMSCFIIPSGGFGLDSAIRLSWNASETEKLLEPGGEPRIVNLTVTYYTLSDHPFIDKIILLYCLLTHQYVTVTLDVGNIPGWCTASFLNSQLRFPITVNESSQVTTLVVAVNEFAPAYELCIVTIAASVDTMRGPFGFLPFVNGFDQTCTMSFIPGYRPCIIVAPASDYMNVTPGNSSHLPINITNKGNAQTVVFTDIVDSPPGDWSIAITDHIDLDVNMSQYAYLSVIPPNNFSGTENITITFTPCLYVYPPQHGEPVYITIVVICEP